MEITTPLFIELKNKNISIELSNVGASIYRIRFNNEDMVVTPINKDDFFKKNTYFGKTIGRVAGRIELNDKRYNLQKNDGELSLHGGFDGISTKAFPYKKENNKVEFTYLSKDGEAGYPGNLSLKVIYELLDDGLRVNYFASVDQPCLVALTNHTYFCLGEKDNKKLVLSIDSDEHIEIDSHLKPVCRKTNDIKFNEPFKTDVDTFFYLKDKVIRLNGEHYALEITTDYEGVQVFTDHFDDGISVYNSKETNHRGLAIEPEDDQLDRKELLPNHKYERYIEYRFKKL